MAEPVGVHPRTSNRRPKRTVSCAIAVLSALTIGLSACSSTTKASTQTNNHASGSLIPVRIAAIVSSGQGEFSTAMKAAGLDKKYGLNLTVVPISTTGAQFLALREGSADVASGSVLDLLRQRAAGLKVQSFGAFEHFTNPIVVPGNSSITSFSQLAGKKVGTPSTTLLDWMIVRAAGKKAYGIDLQTQATPVPASPPLLNQLLTNHSVSAALQFESLASTPVSTGQFRQLTSVAGLMKKAGFNPNSFYLLFMVSDSWVSAHPGGLQRLEDAMAATYKLLMTQNAPWTALAAQIGLTKPAQITAYMKSQRASFATQYGPNLIGPTTALMNSLISIAGSKEVGISSVDKNAFLFPASHGVPW